MAAPEDLFARFRQHADADALAAVFDALAPKLLLMAAHVARPGCDAEDLLQATFLDAIEKADRWDAARPLLPWLIGILVNRARIDRRQRARKLDAGRLSHAEEPSPLDALAASEVAEQVAAALASLPRQLRQTLSLRLVHGLTPTEIAHALGCPVATAKTRLQRGMEWLRKVLPAGIAVSVAGVVTTGKGLAAVRAVVMSKAKTLAPVAAGAGTAIAVVAGGLLMKKFAIVAAALLCAAALWVMVPRPGEPARTDNTAAVRPSAMQADLGSGSPDTSTAIAPAANDRVAVPSSKAGAAELQLVWKGEGTPAAGLVLVWYRGPNSIGSTPATTDAQGQLHLADLAAGDYQLSSRLVQHTFTIHTGEVTRERIEVEPFVRFDGIVVDGEGRGVAGAEILRHSLDDWVDPAPPRQLAITNDDGSFRGCADNGGWIWATKSRLVPSEPRSLARGEGSHLRLVLATAGTAVHGAVLAADGRPAPDALLAIVALTPANQLTAPTLLRSDANGRFATHVLAAGEQLLVARAAGHAATPVRFVVAGGIEQELEVRLTLGATVFGTVQLVDRSSAIVVTARPEWAKARPQIAAWCIDRARADGEGNYRLEHVPAGCVTLEAPGISDSVRQLQLVDGEARRCDFAPPGGGEIHGRIVDAADKPVADWWVHAWSQKTGHGKSSSPTDSQGRFRIDDLAGSSYSLTAMPITASSGEPWLEVNDVRPGTGELLLRARYTLQDGSSITGTALDASGAPATEARCSYRPLGATGSWNGKAATLHEGGAFELGPLPPGSYQLRMHIPGSGSVDLGTRELKPRARVDVGTVRVPAPGTMELRFAKPDGTAVTPVDLGASDDAGNICNQFERGSDGVFRSQQRLPAGTYRVGAWGEDFARTRQETVVVAGRATLTDVVVTPAQQVRFELPKPAGLGSGRWVAQAQLRITDSANAFVGRSWLSIDTTDTFALTRGLSPGSYTYEATPQPNGEPVRGAFTVTAGDAGPQRVEIQLPAKAN